MKSPTLSHKIRNIIKSWSEPDSALWLLLFFGNIEIHSTGILNGMELTLSEDVEYKTIA